MLSLIIMTILKPLSGQLNESRDGNGEVHFRVPQIEIFFFCGDEDGEKNYSISILEMETGITPRSAGSLSPKGILVILLKLFKCP